MGGVLETECTEPNDMEFFALQPNVNENMRIKDVYLLIIDKNCFLNIQSRKKSNLIDFFSLWFFSIQ